MVFLLFQYISKLIVRNFITFEYEYAINEGSERPVHPCMFHLAGAFSTYRWKRTCRPICNSRLDDLKSQCGISSASTLFAQINTNLYTEMNHNLKIQNGQFQTYSIKIYWKIHRNEIWWKWWKKLFLDIIFRMGQLKFNFIKMHSNSLSTYKYHSYVSSQSEFSDFQLYTYIGYVFVLLLFFLLFSFALCLSTSAFGRSFVTVSS